MQYMQVIEASDVHSARETYLALIEQRGFMLTPAMTIYVEAVHRRGNEIPSWLCYIATAMQHAA